MAKEVGGDLVILDLLLPERVRVINVYNQKVFRNGQQLNFRPAEHAEWDRILIGRCVLAGDFNTHNP